MDIHEAAPLPEAFTAWAHQALGGRSGAFLRALETPPGASVRLRRAGAPLPFAGVPVPWCPLGRTLADPQARAGKHALHWAGAYYVQEASAMYPVEALDVRPGQLALDMCAAPGGKATQLAGLLGGGFLVANEPHPTRVRALMENLERFGAHAAVLQEEPERIARHFGPVFDRVLVDAPCSGEGMFGKDPASRLAWTPEAPEACARRQLAILSCAAEVVRPGGRLVYSTCTFNERENEGVVAAFLSARPDFAPINPPPRPGVSPCGPGMARIWPDLAPGAGHFAACFQRQSGADARPAPVRAAREESVEALLRGIGAPGGPVLWHQEWAYLAPPVALAGLRVLRPGLQLAGRVGRVLAPAHHLAMSLPEGARQAELPAPAALAFLRGEEVPREGPPGWTIALHQGYPLGFGKQSGGALKNHRPKGLRLSAEA